MVKYYYTALRNSTQIVNGEIEASNPREARDKIRKLGFLPTKVYTEESAAVDIFSVHEELSATKVKRFSLQEKIMFTSELEVLLSAGIPILEVLQTIEKNSPKWKLKEICSKLRDSILLGMTFADALSSLYSKVFGQIYIGLLKTGEDAGELEETLMRMLLLLRKQERIKGRIVSASIYPAILTVIMIGILIIFSKFVIPTFYGVISANAGNIPVYSQMLRHFCCFLNNLWWLIIIGIGVFFSILTALFQDVQFKSKWDEFILRIPVISEFIKYINLSNFMTVLQISYDSGLPILAGLELSNKTVGNYTIKKQIFNVISLVRSGKSLTEAFERTKALPGPLMALIATGEKSGTLGKMFHDAADVIDKKLDMALNALTKLFEPVLIIIMGGFVLFIALGFYGMYFAMLNSLF